jgi:transposase-like protein
MGTSNYSDECKRDAVQQIRVRGDPVWEVSRRVGVSSHSLYKWLRLFAELAPKLGCIATKPRPAICATRVRPAQRTCGPAGQGVTATTMPSPKASSNS